MKELETYIASLGIGLSLGLIGAGGSILTIPVFVYILKKDPVSSSVYSMFVVGISSMAGSVQSIFNKLVDFKAVLTFGIPSVIGVFIARKTIFPVIPDELFSIGSFVLSKDMLLMLCLSSLMFLAARRMLKPALKNKRVDHEDKQVPISFVLRGLFVGIITGLLGIGGGFLIVPALYLLLNLPVKKAIGTALLIITINSLFGFLNSYGSTEIEWHLLMKFSMGAVLGIIIGTRLAQRIPGDYLKKTFGWVILSMSFYIIYRQFFF
jgi:uncharacterized membrane protein YfcA